MKLTRTELRLWRLLGDGTPHTKDELAKSLWRHFEDFWLLHRGYDWAVQSPDIERALCAILFNAMAYLHGKLKEDGEEQLVEIGINDPDPFACVFAGLRGIPEPSLRPSVQPPLTWQKWLSRQTGEEGPHWLPICRSDGPGCILWEAYEKYLRLPGLVK